ncbi:MAG TPA: hypothetical protein EYG89_00520 [Bacteroidia bacterium]|nr:hypothetical protein [Bacteroidia bacterium]
MKKTLTKTKQLFLTGLLLITLNISAQKILQPTNEKSYTEYVDKILQDLKLNDVSNIKNGILFDRIFSVAKLETFNDSINTSNYEHFIQSWKEINNAKINGNFNSIEDLEKIAYHFEKENTIQIGLINIDFTIIDPIALKPNQQKLNIVNNKLQKSPNKDPYITKHALVISPLNSTSLNGNSINFEFGKLILNKSDKKISLITAHFENNQDITLVENGKTINSNFNVNFQNSGLKDIIFNITYLDNTTQTTFANFFINTSLIAKRATASGVSQKQFIKATKPFQGYNEPNDCGGDCYGEGEYKVYFANDNTKITKPFIIVDGFDPGDKRKIDGDEAINSDDEHLYGMMFYNEDNDNLVWDLNQKDYDVIIISFPKYYLKSQVVWWVSYNWFGFPMRHPYFINIYRDGGADYIERNAKVVEALIDKINTTMSDNGNSNTIKIAGPSMGALVVQYALAEMEEDNENHNVDLYVSFDGPHKGANISIGMQKAIDYFDIENAKKPLKSPAAKQMLINHYLSYSEGLPQGAPNFRNRFQTELNRIGFPQNSRNVAVVNGSIIGEEKSITNGTFVNVELSTTWDFLRRSLWINYTKNSGRKTVFRYLKKNWWGANTQSDTKKYSYSSSNYGSLDNASGGYLAIKSKIEKGIGGQFPYFYFGNLATNFNFNNLGLGFEKTLGVLALLDITKTSFYVDMNDDFCFVPTKSALSFTGTNKLWRECLGSRDLVCTGETPFDSYYAPIENQEHADLHIEGMVWLLEEVDGNPQEPSFYNGNCSNSTTNININGLNKLCLNQTSTYSIASNQCSANSSTVNWTTSSNLQIISSNNNEIIVKSISNLDNKWITATSNAQADTKKIIGKPSISSTINPGPIPQIELIGNWINYNLQGITSIVWTQTGGNGTLHASNNSRSAYASGTGSRWFVSGQVQITNSCGTTIRTFGLAPFFRIDPCDDGILDNDLYIQKTNENKYRIINPCTSQIQNIYNAELYNIYGIKTHDIVPIQDKIEFDNIVNSGEVKILKVNVDGKTLTKTIITD